MKFCAQCVETNLLEIIKHTPNTQIFIKALARYISENPKLLDILSLQQTAVHAITHLAQKKTDYCVFKSVDEIDTGEDGIRYSYIFEIENRFFQVQTMRDSHNSERLIYSRPIKEVSLVQKIIHVFEEV